MPGIATGEVFSWPEGKLYLYASASGTTSGSGIGFARQSTLTLTYGWLDLEAADRRMYRAITGRRAEMTIGALYSDRSILALVNASAPVHAKFEGVVTGGAALGKSGQIVLYSGVVDSYAITQSDGAMFSQSLSLHSRDWSAFGQ